MREGDLATICSPVPGEQSVHGYCVCFNGRFDQYIGLRQIPNGTPCLILNSHWSEENAIVLALGVFFEIAPKSLQQVHE